MESFIIFIELENDKDNCLETVTLNVQSNFIPPTIVNGEIVSDGFWEIVSVEFLKDFNFKGTIYKTGSLFPIDLLPFIDVEHTFKDDFKNKYEGVFHEWLSEKIEDISKDF